MTLARWQSTAVTAAVVALVLGLLASVGVRLLPVLPWSLLVIAHPLVATLGVAAGRAAVLRGREIDAERWAVVDEPLATRQEQEYAHKEAERERRVSASIFLAAPVLVGYWGLYQFGAAGPGSWALPVTGLAGYLAGYLYENRLGGPERRF